jgi:aerotaxis receptor
MHNTGPLTGQESVFEDRVMLVSTTDLKSYITYCNPVFIQVSGYHREELLGQPHNMIRHPDVPAEAFRDLWATLAEGLPWTGLVKNRRKNGDHYWVRANVTLVVEKGRTVGYMSVRVKPSRQGVAAAEALYAEMRRNPQRYRLHHGEPHERSLMGRLRTTRRWGLGGRIVAMSLGTSVGNAALAASGLHWTLSAGAGLGMALWLRHLAVTPLRNAIATANCLAAGQLGSAVPKAGADEVRQLMHALAQLDVNLQAIVGDVWREVEGIRTAAHEIATGNGDLGTRTETQAGSVQHTASSVEQIAVTLRNSAEHAETARGLAQEAADAARQGGQSMQEMVQRMGEIREASQRIGAIIQVIDGISFQTNILATSWRSTPRWKPRAPARPGAASQSWPARCAPWRARPPTRRARSSTSSATPPRAWKPATRWPRPRCSQSRKQLSTTRHASQTF